MNYDDYKEKYMKVTLRGGETKNPAFYNNYEKPIYIYPDYYKYLYDYESAHPGETAPAYCNSKSWIQTANGWQIFADKPCFVKLLHSGRIFFWELQARFVFF